ERASPPPAASVSVRERERLKCSVPTASHRPAIFPSDGSEFGRDGVGRTRTRPPAFHLSHLFPASHARPRSLPPPRPAGCKAPRRGAGRGPSQEDGGLPARRPRTGCARRGAAVPRQPPALRLPPRRGPRLRKHAGATDPAAPASRLL